MLMILDDYPFETMAIRKVIILPANKKSIPYECHSPESLERQQEWFDAIYASVKLLKEAQSEELGL